MSFWSPWLFDFARFAVPAVYNKMAERYLRARHNIDGWSNLVLLSCTDFNIVGGGVSLITARFYIRPSNKAIANTKYTQKGRSPRDVLRGCGRRLCSICGIFSDRMCQLANISNLCCCCYARPHKFIVLFPVTISNLKRISYILTIGVITIQKRIAIVSHKPRVNLEICNIIIGN